MLLLVAVHAATAVWQWTKGYEDLLPALLLDRDTRFRVAAGGQFHALVADGELWRLATCVLLHGDALHLAVNAVALATLGRLVEPWVGAARALAWFAAGGLAGAIASQAVGVIQSDGASGGAFAWLAAATVLVTRDRDRWAPDDRRVLVRALWGFLVANVVLSFVLPFVDAAGHMGGLGAGLVAGATWRRATAAGTVAHAALAVAFFAACAVGFALAVAR